MESSPSNSTVGIAAVPSKRPSRRLLFDRRYGWVVDEWKHPSEEALAGGRGMFCILPLAKSLWMMASKSIDFASNYAVEVIQKPELLSPHTLQANLGTQLNSFKSSLLNPDFNPLVRNSPPSDSPRAFSTSHVKLDNTEPQTD
ncbi:unnamed protein product [Linum tenue]|uniref:Uncharacterized protein n=1 Tax=Linum tenue TaxID=586396 RepID=A0AAV0RF75_9ROSI|nr:unnamed protein product [Linum tenue]